MAIVLKSMNQQSDNDLMNTHTYITVCPPPIRNSGRTQWMIDQLCDAVVSGQPKCRVYGHTLDFTLRVLKPRVIKELQKRGMKIDRISYERIDVEGTVILFSSTNLSKNYYRGFLGFGHFVDHYAAGEI